MRVLGEDCIYTLWQQPEERGVEKTLENLQNELIRNMKLLGVKNF